MKALIRYGALGGASLLLLASAVATSKLAPTHRNIVIFVADGLRPGSVTPTSAPTLYKLRKHGVNFVNSHAVFPTFTTPNASAISTGHDLGDTGDFSNTIYSGYPIFNTGNFGKLSGTVTPFVENDQILADLDDHYNGNYLNQETLMALARQSGYNTASVGKQGPVAIQDVSQLQPVGKQFSVPETVFVDDSTGTASGIPLRPDIVAAFGVAGLATAAPTRSNGCGATDQCSNGFSGNNTTPGTTSPNVVQQQYFADVTTKAVLPTFVDSGKPFMILFWSRDPDGTQHNQGDSLNSLTPGINGPTSLAAVHNMDSNLKQILDYINGHPDLAANTDVFVTADHGFATISRHEVDKHGGVTASYAAQFTYVDSTGRVEVNPGFLPPGFLAIDIAHKLGLPLYDPDSIITDASGNRLDEPVDPTITQQTATIRQRPANGDGLIGASGQILDNTDAKVVVAANGGSDLIYVPDHNRARVRRIADFLAAQDYVGALFVDDTYGAVPGALPMSLIALFGNSPLPRPAIAVGFKTFYLKPFDLQSAVQIADTGLQEGQGMHGSLGRDNTFNTMAAIGPDFKHSFLDFSPVSNADIAPTLARAMGLELPSNGFLKGRVLWEALAGGPPVVPSVLLRRVSQQAASGKQTMFLFQRVGAATYFDAACFGSDGDCQ